MKLIRGAGILLVKDDKVVLQHRDEHAPTNPNKWTVFGGGIDGDETPEQACIREAKEELQIDIIPEFLFKIIFEFEDFTDESYIFKAPLTIPLEQLKEQQTEGIGLGLFSKDEAQKLDLDYFGSGVLKKYFK